MGKRCCSTGHCKTVERAVSPSLRSAALYLINASLKENLTVVDSHCCPPGVQVESVFLPPSPSSVVQTVTWAQQGEEASQQCFADHPMALIANAE